MPYDVEPRPRQKLVKLLGKEAQMQVFGEYVYSIFDVMDFFGVKRASVQEWIRKGELRAAKIGNNWWIRGSAINDFLTARENRLREYYKAKLPDNDLIVANGV